MPKKTINVLLEIYQRLLPRCEQHLAVLTEYNKVLDDYQTSKQDKKVLSHPETADALVLTEQEEIFDALLQKFSETRAQTFADFKSDVDKSSQLKNELCQAIGVLLFRNELLEPYLSATEYRQFCESYDALGSALDKIREMDQQIIPKIQTELESVKIELARIRGVKKMRFAYGSPVSREPRFIDKSK
jgi:hypothetical protein